MASRGFTLVEAAVAIAVVAILAGTMAPLALKALDQRREASTRRSLKLAFEAMFGARDRRIANMRSDFGFTVDRSLATLPVLVRNPGIRDLGRWDGASFEWGWNGPYWHGPVGNGVPVDAWGSPIQVHFEAHDHSSVQMVSLGPRRRWGQGSIFYPPVPVPLASLQTRVILHITPSRPDLRCEVVIRCGQATAAGLLARTPALAIAPGEGVVHATRLVPAGTMEVTVEPGIGGAVPAGFRPIPLDLLPGETREVSVTL
jgi:prepilin-type N-terminal cleavage/methylation domain-containing protein